MYNYYTVCPTENSGFNNNIFVGIQKPRMWWFKINTFLWIYWSQKHKNQTDVFFLILKICIKLKNKICWAGLALFFSHHYYAHIYKNIFVYIFFQEYTDLISHVQTCHHHINIIKSIWRMNCNEIIRGHFIKHYK